MSITFMKEQEAGKSFYFARDYNRAYKYYKKFLDIKKSENLDIYNTENAKIGYVLFKEGNKEESEELFKNFKAYSDGDNSIYKHLNQALYYSYMGDTRNAIGQLKLFSQQENYHYWTILFLKLDPLLDNIKDLPEFDSIYNILESHFWENHNKITARLTGEKLL